MTSTLTSLANSAAESIGVLDSGEGLSAQQLADCLLAANEILDNWGSNQILIPQVADQIVALTANNNQYGVGPALAWNVNPTPVRITSASLIMSNNVTDPIEVISSAKWDTIPDRSSTSNKIKYLFYTQAPLSVPGFSGLAKVSPTPAANGASLWIQFWRPFQQFADTTTANTLIPAGYLKALRMELGKMMSGMLDVPWSQTNEDQRKEAYANLVQLNQQLWGMINTAAPNQPAT